MSEPAPDTADPSLSRARRLPVRPLTVAVFVVFLVLASVISTLTGRLEQNQERRLLHERASEVGLAMSSYVYSYLQSPLQQMAFALQGGLPAFIKLAQTVEDASKGFLASLVVVQRDSQGWTVVGGVGTALPAGQRVTGARADLMNKADDQIHGAVITRSGTGVSLGVIQGLGSAPATMAIYQEYVMGTTQQQLPATDAYSDVNLAIYAGLEPRDEALVFNTGGKPPFKGMTATSTFKAGQYDQDGQGGRESWLVVASPKSSLTGTLAERLPLILFLTMLLLGIALAALTEVMARRRDYAFGLVAERTAELQTSFRELECAQSQLVQSQRLAALGQMAATVGHELRNPLAVLTNSMYLIRHAVEPTASEKLARQLNTADREIAAATLIVSDLLEFSKPRQTTPSSVDVADLIAETVTAAPPPTGIEVEQDAETIPPLVADRAQLRQVLLNLLTNSYDAMPSGGKVRIEARSTNGTMKVSVTDTGSGIDSDALPNVFEPFFTSKVKGVGLGLAVSRKIVESHKGTLTLEPRPEGGAVATMELPLVGVSSGDAS